MKRTASAVLSVLIVFSMLLSSAAVRAAVPEYDPSSTYASSVYYRNFRDLVLTGNQRLDLVNVCLTQVGYHEGNSAADIDGSNPYGTSDYTEYGRWYGEEVLNTNPFYTPWCAIFVSWAARQAGMPEYVINNSAYAHIGVNPCYFHVPYRSPGTYQPKTGDLIFYDYTGTGQGWSHVGVVLYTQGGAVYSIEGNYTKRVTVVGHMLNDPIIRGYGAPSYPASAAASALSPSSYQRPDSNLQKGSTGSSVSWIQAALLHLGYPTPVDGSFSSQTERALKSFQKAKGISATGVCGPATREKLLSLVSGGSSPTGGNTQNNFPVPTRTLRAGDSGEDVKWLQTELKNLGLMDVVTGYYGTVTEDAVRALQARLGVSQTGTFGSITRAALLSQLGLSENTGGTTQQPTGGNQQSGETTYPIPTRTLKKGDRGDDVKWVQAVLKKVGFRIGITGYYGSTTTAYVKKFQHGFGLSETGKVDDRTRAYMKAYAANISSQTQPPSQQPSGGNQQDQSDPTSYPVPERDLRRGCSGDDVKWLQAALRAMGLDFDVTGYFGDKTEAGVRWFQRGYGLTETGVCDTRTRAYIKNVLRTLGH